MTAFIAFSRLAAAVGAIASATLLSGCIADSTDNGGGSGPATGPYASSSGPGNTAPIIVDVDTGATLVTTPGNGIGVYIEYESGGHWLVSWTCDTALTSLSCNFTVDASVATGAISNVAADDLEAGDGVTQRNAEQIETVTTTTTGTDGMTFDTVPGATITLTVALNAPVSFFFVQDNLVNGGYKGTLTNPLMLQPSTP